MSGWIIVNFIDDNTVSVVPDSWFKNNTCAWPKNHKNSQKIIESRVQPNEKDFYFYNVRRMSEKTYYSLDKAKSKLFKAQTKSDISSTEDETIRSDKIKYNLKRHSSSPTSKLLKKVKDSRNQYKSSLSGPPQYNPVKDTIGKDIHSGSNIKQTLNVSDSDTNSSNFDDSDKDPTWSSKPKSDLEQEPDITTPLKATPLTFTQSPVIMSSPSGSWRVSQVDKNIYGNSAVGNNSVKRQLQYSVENQNQISDLYKMSISSLSFLKYEVQALKILCHSMNDNIEKLMNNSSESTIAYDGLDIELLIPIKNDEDMLALNNKIQDTNLRKLLVSKISLFVGKKDIRNSVRRIMARMFDDRFLINYSLYGFKKKQSFSNLPYYRLIIDALRLHIKYKAVTDKEIDEPLGTWLTHAPYRILKTNNKNIL